MRETGEQYGPEAAHLMEVIDHRLSEGMEGLQAFDDCFFIVVDAPARFPALHQSRFHCIV